MSPGRRFPELWNAQWLRHAATQWTDAEIAARLGCTPNSVAARRAAFGILPNAPGPKGVGGAERLRTLWLTTADAREAAEKGCLVYQEHDVTCCSLAEWLTWWLEAARVAQLVGQEPGLALFCEDAQPDWCAAAQQSDCCVCPLATTEQAPQAQSKDPTPA